MNIAELVAKAISDFDADNMAASLKTLFLKKSKDGDHPVGVYGAFLVWVLLLVMMTSLTLWHVVLIVGGGAGLVWLREKFDAENEEAPKSE